MNRGQREAQIRDSLRRLAVAYAQAMRQLEETLEILNREYDLGGLLATENQTRESISSQPDEDLTRPLADRSTLSVVWRGRSCFLGNTLLFRFFAALVRRPGCYRSHSELLDEVWGGLRAEASIRHVVKRLRDKLRRAGMSDLAQAIDGTERGYFKLRLDSAK